MEFLFGFIEPFHVWDVNHSRVGINLLVHEHDGFRLRPDNASGVLLDVILVTDDQNLVCLDNVGCLFSSNS